MSELEKQEREEYRSFRKKCILAQIIQIACLTLAFIIAFSVFLTLDKETYVSYKEQGSVVYKAYLQDNKFYSEEYLNGSHAYVAALIDSMTADFTYDLYMDADKVNYKYTYKIDAQVEVKDKDSGMAIYNPVYELVPQKSASVSGSRLHISDKVAIDYNAYNALAQEFIRSYNLKNTVNTLVVRMYVDVVGESEKFADDRSGEYVIELFVPLVSQTVSPSVETSVPEGEQRILAISNDSRTVFKVLSVVFCIFDILAIILFALFIIFTRDQHIDYARKVKKIVSNYKSYIQKINNEFDFDGYQVLHVDTFAEMLEIRDTIQIPILMYENEDRTCTQFFMATYSKILYLYDVKVEEYEDDYICTETADVVEEVLEETVEEPVEEIVEEECLDEIPQEEVSEPVEDEVAVVADEPVEEDDGKIEVIGVVWPEGEKQDKIYQYDPDGEKLDRGDVVLVPTHDAANQKDLVREATVARENYRVDPHTLKYPLKKIISVVKRNISNMF